MDQTKIRNIAIIAHVDHGKTTLVDELFKQSGVFRSNQIVGERIMDSSDLEKERGITITSKNGSFHYKDNLVNIVDTPGHADFSGQVERILGMVDGALLLVDAAEGPMPQTYYVLKKALSLKLHILVVINKIDKPAARCEWTLDQVYELFIKLDASSKALDFHVVYTSAKEGFATLDPKVKTDNMTCLFDKIIEYIPYPKGDGEGPLQMLVSSLTYSPFLGRLGIGKITSGKLNINKEIVVSRGDSEIVTARITKLYKFEGTAMVETEVATVGEIVVAAGMENVTIGETLTDRDNPIPLPGIKVDPPTISMNFIVNDSPFAGKEGRFVTSTHLRERLLREILGDVALHVEEIQGTPGFKVSGRGELHLSILIEKMRREGYEFQVTRPEVIIKIVDGKRHEPYEELTIDVDENYMGPVIENLGKRKGQYLNLHQENGMARLLYKIPTRGLLGFRSEFLTMTRGMGIMNYIFLEFDVYAGEIKNRKNGALVSMENGVAVAYALFNLQERGKLFLGPQSKIYEGQIVGEHSRDRDLMVNPTKTKKLTNMRAAGSDENIILVPPVHMSLEDCISYINDDELVEITPTNIRLRKIMLREIERRRMKSPELKAS
jgi:GTP-binding protein